MEGRERFVNIGTLLLLGTYPSAACFGESRIPIPDPFAIPFCYFCYEIVSDVDNGKYPRSVVMK